jgi:hypothetical protein
MMLSTLNSDRNQRELSLPLLWPWGHPSCTWRHYEKKPKWDILCEGKTWQKKKRYFCTEMKGGTSMEMHLKQMKEITAAIGATISDEDQVVTLLGSFPPSYSVLG